jgi:ANTAR domain-containing protein/GAF domain-containing protein
MEDYEDGVEQAVAPPTAEALEAAVRPALVAATRLFLVAGVVLAVVDERGEPGWAVAAGDFAELLERATGPLWAGPCQEVLGSGSLVRTSSLPDDARWPELAAALGFAGVNSLLCVPVEGAAGPAGVLTVVRRPDRPWQVHEVESVMTYGVVLAGLLRVAGESETRAQVITQLEHALRHRVMIEQAKGILMEREGLDPAAAFDRLRRAARADRRRVGEVAAEVVGGEAPPEPEDSAS